MPPGVVPSVCPSVGFCRSACFVGGVIAATSVTARRRTNQGGEFAFVAFGMAERLGILEPQLCKLLLTTVAISMAATPALSTFSAWVADQVRETQPVERSVRTHRQFRGRRR